MAEKRDRIGIVGATTLLGKELSEELPESPLGLAEVVLFEDDATEGQLSAAGDEPSFVQALSDDSFRGLDVVFFAGSAEQTREYWQAARRSGAAVVDLTHTLGEEPGVLLRSPTVDEAMDEAHRRIGQKPGLDTAAIVAPEPLAALLALLALRLGPELRRMAATVLLPASEHGREALDELHQQTVSLLSFHDLPRTQFDAQTAFNLLAAFGEDAAADLARVERQIADDYGTLGGGQLAPLRLQVVQAPVFHGYVASILVELGGATSVAELSQRLRGRPVELVEAGEDAPSNLSAAGSRSLLLQIRSAARTPEARGEAFWLWVAADNLKLRAAGAIECAVELRRLRPVGKVQ